MTGGLLVGLGLVDGLVEAGTVEADGFDTWGLVLIDGGVEFNVLLSAVRFSPS